MIRANFDVTAFVRDLSEVEKSQFPYAVLQALNETAFEVREGWRTEITKVFDRPIDYTLRAPLYRKATKADLQAEVYLRNKPGSQIPQAAYLFSQVEGGSRRPKRSEVLLRQAGILGPGEFWVPGKGAGPILDAGGNIKGSAIRAILSDVQASFDPTANSTRDSRGKRSKRRKRRGGVYFYNRAQRGRLPRGIFERIQTGFGSSVRSVLHIVQAVQYRKRYDVEGVAERLFNQRFEPNLRHWLVRALATRRGA
jgi:hypothetical protein